MAAAINMVYAGRKARIFAVGDLPADKVGIRAVTTAAAS